MSNSLKEVLKGVIFWCLLTVISFGANGVTADSVLIFPIQWQTLTFPLSSTDMEKQPEFKAVISDSNIVHASHLTRTGRGISLTSQIDTSGRFILFSEKWEGKALLPERIILLQDYVKERIKYQFHQDFYSLVTSYKKKEAQRRGGEKLEVVGANIAGQRVSLRVSGNININGRLVRQRQSLVQATAYSGKTTQFRIDQSQRFDIEGKIGDRVSVLVDQNSERDFDFENNLKIIYTGQEDEIVQKIEAGNISLSLPSTRYVTYSGKNEGLFGLKSKMKLGGMDITTIASVVRGKNEKMTIDGGATSQEIIIKDINYRRRTYFFLDEFFRKNFYPLQNSYHRISQYIVEDIQVYKRLSGNIRESGTVLGKAWIDPNDHNKHPEYMEEGIFKRLDLGLDYEYSPDLGFIRFNSPLQESDVIGVTFRIALRDNKDSTIVAYGDWDRALDDTSEIELKLIKPENFIPDHPLWDLEFKNVYYLGTQNIQSEGFDLYIRYLNGKNGNDIRDINGVNFLTIFGLDSLDENGNAQPDEKIDINNQNILDQARGELIFPFLRPFQKETGEEGEFPGLKNPNLASSDYDCSPIYEANPSDRQALNAAHKFDIVVKYKNRTSTIELGGLVIEGSEEVYLNNNLLVRGKDYDIDYFSGTITLLKPEARDPTASLEIKYQKQQLFQLDKQTILGSRAQIDFGKNSFLGATALYFSKTVIDEKVDVGFEPMQNFVLDMNTRFNFQLDPLTRVINALPLIETSKPSTFNLEGEIARIYPNPNPINNPRTGDYRGVAFIDDFESSKRTTSPPLIRIYWDHSSIPIGKKNSQRGFLYWFNPRVLTTDIWPNKETSARAGNKFTDILTLVFQPYWSIDVVDGFATQEEAWGGITYPFPQSYMDQSKTKYVEIWIKGSRGVVHLDLGDISEDQDGDGVLDTEDKASDDGFISGNKVLDKGEDVGIDGVPDPDEFIVNNFGDTLRYGDERLRKYRRDPQDPHSDNWHYKEGSSDYRGISGTEGNGKQIGGNIPDTEDLDDDAKLDKMNAYFTVDIDLSKSKYVEGTTSKGWKLYRIPLYDFQPIGDQDPDWQSIKYCRLWVDGTPSPDTMLVINIAKIELVGNEWEELGVAENDSADFIKDDLTFGVSVINTEDNPDRYKPPKGVQGEYDRVNEVRTKEQSLILWFDGSGIPPGALAAARKDLPEIQDYTLYKQIKLYIHGRNLRTGTGKYIDEQFHPIDFFIRFVRQGNGSDYYEVTKPILPDWNKQLIIDLDLLTMLKDVTISDTARHIEVRYVNNQKVVTWTEYDKNGEPTGVRYKSVGEPSFNRVHSLIMGIKNNLPQRNRLTLEAVNKSYNTPDYVFGEVWVDELRVSDVRRDRGTALRTTARLDLADLASITTNIERRDADFHNATERLGKKSSSRNFALSARFNVNKFLPQEWGISIPFSLNLNQSVSIPKYYPGSDRLTGNAAPDSILSKTMSRSFSTSFNKTTNSDFWLVKYTIDQIETSFNAKWSNSSNEINREKSNQTYNGSFKYGIPFGRDNYFHPLKWMQEVPLIGNKASEFKFFYLPSRFVTSLAVTETHGRTIPRRGETTYMAPTLNLNRNFDFKYKISENLDFSFNKKIKSDLRDYIRNKVDAIKRFDPGKITNITENYSLNFTPRLFSWFSPNITYSSSYRWSEASNSQTRFVDNLGAQSRLSANLNLNLVSIMEMFYRPPSETKTRRTPTPGRRGGRRGNRSSTTGSDKQKEDKKKTPQKEIKALTFIYKGLKRIKPLNITWSTNRNVTSFWRIGSPGLAYRLGFTTDPGLPLDSTSAGVTLDNISRKMNYSIRTGVDITNNIMTTLSHNGSRNKTLGQGGRITENFSRDFIPLGRKGKNGFPFFSWSIRISNLHRFKFLKDYFNNISLDHSFNGMETIVKQDGEETNSSYTATFSPLLGISMMFKNGISASFRFTNGLQINNRNGGTDRIYTRNYTASASYQHRGGLKLPIPGFQDLNLQNTIQFTLNLDYSENTTLSRNTGGSKFSPSKRNTNLVIKPQVSYSFTSKVTGGIFFEYREMNNLYTGKQVSRDYGFEINIAIKG